MLGQFDLNLPAQEILQEDIGQLMQPQDDHVAENNVAEHVAHLVHHAVVGVLLEAPLPVDNDAEHVAPMDLVAAVENLQAAPITKNPIEVQPESLLNNSSSPDNCSIQIALATVHNIAGPTAASPTTVATATMAPTTVDIPFENHTTACTTKNVTAQLPPLSGTAPREDIVATVDHFTQAGVNDKDA